MNKEKEPKHDIGYSEKALDLAVDKGLTRDQVKGGSIFDPRRKKVSRVSRVPKVSQRKQD